MIAEGTTGTEICTVKEKILSCAMKTIESDSWECTITCGMIEDHKFARLRLKKAKSCILTDGVAHNKMEWQEYMHNWPK